MIEGLLKYKRHKRKEFWITTFLGMGEKLGIDYLDLRGMEVNEFFYLMKEFERKLKPDTDGG